MRDGANLIRDDKEDEFYCEFEGCVVQLPCNNVSMQHSLRFSYLAAILSVCAIVLLMPHAARAAQITVTITDNSFTPSNITVNAGDTVTWINNGATAHTATASNGSFDSGTIQPGQTFGAVFNAAGTYAYRCKFHSGMTGTISVVTPGVAPSTVVNTNTNSNTNTNTNANAAQLQAQAQALLAQVAALQAQLGGATATNAGTGGVRDASSCPLIGRSLRKGISGDDVLRLQQFLARDPSVYPEAITSGYYGALTERAVQRWQVKYNIVSSGSPSSTGYGVVGPRTASAIALLCTTGSYGGISGPAGQATVGGFITVSPISGAAPLTVNVTATVNTPGSCAAAVYSLDFGDGTAIQQIPVSAGICAQLNQTYPHVYRYGGTYQIKLSAGAHSTSATVTVSGTPAPQFTPDLPRESFGVAPTSGPAPLTVTFSGIVNSNDAGFCLGGCASTLDFGDGTGTSINLPASVGGWLNYSVSHTYTQSGGFRATLYQGGASVGGPIVGSATIIVGAAAPPPAPGAYSYSPPSLSPSGSDPLSFSIQFDLPSACAGYQLRWGDGSSDITQNDGGSSCTQTPTLKTFTHTYATGGNYTILVKRGATLSRSDDLSLKIQ